MESLKQVVLASGPVLAAAGALLAADNPPAGVAASQRSTPVAVSGVRVIEAGGVRGLLPGTDVPTGNTGPDIMTMMRFQRTLPQAVFPPPTNLGGVRP